MKLIDFGIAKRLDEDLCSGLGLVERFEKSRMAGHLLVSELRTTWLQRPASMWFWEGTASRSRELSGHSQPKRGLRH